MGRAFSKCLRNCKGNPWIVVSGILLVVLVIILFYGNSVAGSVSAEEVGQKILNFANAQGANAELVEISNGGFFYEVVLSIQGQEVSLYVTKDGKSFTQTLIPLDSLDDEKPSSQMPSLSNVQNSDRPNVELFIMSHCLYGTQIEKGIIPVVRELKDYIDFEIKFVNYAMHPSQGEVEEQLNQYCIQKEQNDKYLDYLSCFLEDGNGERCLEKVGIDLDELEFCIGRVDEEFDIIKNLEDKSSWSGGRFPKFMIYDLDNKKYGVQGSPTLIINGEKVKSGRDAQSLLDIICSAFITQPEGCNNDMTSFGNPAPGFGFDGQGGSAGCGI